MGRGMAKAENLELASMRQVAEELELSFAIHEKGQHPNIRFYKLDEFEEKIKRANRLFSRLARHIEKPGERCSLWPVKF
jgi:hypothetical protein